MSKMSTFFEQSGKKTLVSAGSKRKDDLNFKFFKMLLARSGEFSSFIELVYKKEIEEHLDVVEFQCITILRQLMIEAEEKKKKIEENETKQPQMVAEEEESIEPTPIPGISSGIQRKTSIQNRARTESDAILYEEDEEEQLAKPILQKRASNVDDKTKEYLAFVKKLQYEDEYDDTHDVGDGRMNRKGRGGQFRNDRRGRREKSDDSEPEEDEVEKGSGFPVENEAEDSGEEFDPMNKWERTQSNMREDDEEGPLQRNIFRGGRGGRGGGGHKVDGKKEKYNQSKYGGFRKDDNPRENQGGYYHKKEEDYRQRDIENRDDYRPRGNERDQYKAKPYEQRNDNRDEYKDKNDRGRQGQYGKPKQGNRDTR